MQLILYATPGANMPGSTAVGLGTPDASYESVGDGYHDLAEDAPDAIAAEILAWRAGR